MVYGEKYFGEEWTGAKDRKELQGRKRIESLLWQGFAFSLHIPDLKAWWHLWHVHDSKTKDHEKYSQAFWKNRSDSGSKDACLSICTFNKWRVRVELTLTNHKIRKGKG